MQSPHLNKPLYDGNLGYLKENNFIFKFLKKIFSKTTTLCVITETAISTYLLQWLQWFHKNQHVMC